MSMNMSIAVVLHHCKIKFWFFVITHYYYTHTRTHVMMYVYTYFSLQMDQGKQTGHFFFKQKTQTEAKMPSFAKDLPVCNFYIIYMITDNNISVVISEPRLVITCLKFWYWSHTKSSVTTLKCQSLSIHPGWAYDTDFTSHSSIWRIGYSTTVTVCINYFKKSSFFFYSEKSPTPVYFCFDVYKL